MSSMYPFGCKKRLRIHPSPTFSEGLCDDKTYVAGGLADRDQAFAIVPFSPQLGHFWGLHLPSFVAPHLLQVKTAISDHLLGVV